MPRRLGGSLGAAVTASLVLLSAAAPATEEDQLRWLGETRYMAVLAPAAAGEAAPLLLVFGVAGRSARHALDSWRPLAEREGLIVAAISSARPQMWRAPHDGPGLLRAVVERVASRHEIDRRRVYLFGAGPGGGFALSMALLQPSYFAAAASFGGDLPPGALGEAGRLGRALPVRLYVARRTPPSEVEALERTAESLREAGAEVELDRLAGGRDFERLGRKAAERIWADLGRHALGEQPRYRRTPFD